VTVQLPPDVDVEPMLVCTNGHKDGASVIFEYNWRMSGDPNTHELRLSSFIPGIQLSCSHARWLAGVDSYPHSPPPYLFKSPYPSPSWATPSQNYNGQVAVP